MNIHSLNTAQARKPRPLSIENLSRDDFDAKLPFGQFLQVMFPTGRFGSNDRDYVFHATDFIADCSREWWLDLATGDEGVGLIEFLARRYGIDIKEAERRMRMWAVIAEPIEDKDGVDWGMPEPAQPN